jgi:hypothetical protein
LRRSRVRTRRQTEIGLPARWRSTTSGTRCHPGDSGTTHRTDGVSAP